MAGRPSRLTEPVMHSIIESIRGGNYRGIAAQCAGIPEVTMYTWMQHGKKAKDDNNKHRAFYLRVLKAEAEAEINSLKHIKLAEQKDWRAAMTFLERKAPERWADKKQIEMTAEITVKDFAASFQAAMKNEDDIEGGGKLGWKDERHDKFLDAEALPGDDDED